MVFILISILKILFPNLEFIIKLIMLIMGIMNRSQLTIIMGIMFIIKMYSVIEIRFIIKIQSAMFIR